MSTLDEVPIDKRIEQLYWELCLRSDGIVWLVRTSLRAFHQSYDDFLPVVDDWLIEQRIRAGHVGTRTRTPLGWLFDLRGAPDLRNDSEFEAALRERRRDLLKRSPALAILVRTPAGEMQLARITHGKDAVLGVFSDPGEIVGWLNKRMRESFA